MLCQLRKLSERVNFFMLSFIIYGRQSYSINLSLSVWEVIMIAQDCDMDIQKTVEHLHYLVEWVKATLLDAETCFNEINLVSLLVN